MRSDLYETWLDTKKCWYRNKCSDCDTEYCVYTCKRFEQTKFLLDLSNLPLKYRKSQNLDINKLSDDASDYISSIYLNSKHFVKNGYNVYFYGEPGVGKTSWAIQVLTNYFAYISIYNHFECRGLFISVPSFLRDAKLHMTYKSENFRELLETLKTCDLVIWDDIVQTNPTDYESQWLYSFINERLNNSKANIFTSNLSPEKLYNIDKRLHSRICTNSDCIEIVTHDLRCSRSFKNDLPQLLVDEK